MASLEDLDQRIAIVRDNIREMTEQAPAYSARRTNRSPLTASRRTSGRFRTRLRSVRRLSTARVRREPEVSGREPQLRRAIV
jgi:hypothetical protein